MKVKAIITSIVAAVACVALSKADENQARYPAISVSSPTSHFTDSDLTIRWLGDDIYVAPVLLDANGGRGGPYLVKVKADSDYDRTGYTLPNCPFTREGYKFDGWDVFTRCHSSDDGGYELDGGVAGFAGTYQPGFFFDVCAATVLRARWAKTHVLTMYRNNSTGDGAGARREVVDGDYYTLPTISSLGWTRDDYMFKGWATYRGATTASYGDGERIYAYSWMNALYAVWEEDSHVMTLYRNNSGGDGAGARRKVPNGGYYTLPTISSLGWTRSGYTFKGWASYSGAMSAEYGDGERIYVYSWMNALYAVWEDNTYMLTLYRNNSGGDGAGARRKVPDGGYYTLPTIASLGWTRSGYTFKGWATYRSAASASYGDGARIYVDSGFSALYAVWEANTRLMTLYRNNSGGDGAGARRKVPDGGYYTLPTIASLGWTRSGYTFKGWATYRSATSASYGDGARIYVSSSFNSLYGVWEANTHVMTLYRNNSGGDGAGARRKVPDGGYYTLPTIASLGWTRSGYTFKGWATYRSAASASYGDGARIYISSNLNVLYAVWEATAVKYVVRLHRNNSAGDGATASRTMVVDSWRDLPTISSLGWSRSGYYFAGWSYYPDASSYDVYYWDGESVCNLSRDAGDEVHLYAVWQ